MVSGNDAHGEAGPEYWTTPNPCAEPMCEAAENPSPVSSGVLVTVGSMIYSTTTCDLLLTFTVLRLLCD